MKGWMTRESVNFATVHERKTPHSRPLASGETNDFDPQRHMRKAVSWVPPEQSSASNHREAAILVKELLAAFCNSFVPEWTEQCADSLAYQHVQQYASLATILSSHKNGSVESNLRGGINTMITSTVNTFEKLFEFIERAFPKERLDGSSQLVCTAARDHGGFLAELGSFGIGSFSVLEKKFTASAQEGTIPEDLLEFYRMFSFLQDDPETGTDSISVIHLPYLDRYFGLRGVQERAPVLDINVETFTFQDLATMAHPIYRTGCHARGVVMKEMTKWVMDVYLKFVLPMFEFERSKRQS